jgi:hypothetical protein
MSRHLQSHVLRWLIGGATMLLWVMVIPLAALADPLGPAQPSFPNDLSKRVFIPSQPQVGGIVIFQVAFSLSSPQQNVTIEDTISNAGVSPGTTIITPTDEEHAHGFPASPVLFGIGPNPPVGTIESIPFTQLFNQPNRIVYVFRLGSLPAGRYELYYDVRFSNTLGCATQVGNGANLDVAGVAGHLATARMTLPLRCGGPAPLVAAPLTLGSASPVWIPTN